MFSLKKDSSEILQPIDTEGKVPQRLSGAKVLEPSYLNTPSIIYLFA